MKGGYPAAQLGCQISGCEFARLAVAGRPEPEVAGTEFGVPRQSNWNLGVSGEMTLGLELLGPVN